MAELEPTHQRRRRDEPRDGGQEVGARDRLNWSACAPRPSPPDKPSSSGRPRGSVRGARFAFLPSAVGAGPAVQGPLADPGFGPPKPVVLCDEVQLRIAGLSLARNVLASAALAVYAALAVRL